MSRRVFDITYLLALIAGGLISLTDPPVRWGGLVLLIVAFVLPVVCLGRPGHQKPTKKEDN